MRPVLQSLLIVLLESTSEGHRINDDFSGRSHLPALDLRSYTIARDITWGQYVDAIGIPGPAVWPVVDVYNDDEASGQWYDGTEVSQSDIVRGSSEHIAHRRNF